MNKKNNIYPITRFMTNPPGITTVQFSIFPSPSAQCILYPLILDCTVNDMLDIKLGDLDVKSVKNGRLLGNGAGFVTRLLTVAYDSVPNEVMLSSLILHLITIVSVTMH